MNVKVTILSSTIFNIDWLKEDMIINLNVYFVKI